MNCADSKQHFIHSALKTFFFPLGVSKLVLTINLALKDLNHAKFFTQVRMLIPH